MKCPVCKTTDLLMAERRSIEIDYCPDCRGVWLDRGELDKLIAQDNGDCVAPVTARDSRNSGDNRDNYRDHDRHRSYDTHREHDKYRTGYQSGYKKKRSIFDVFDFD